jgi:hypothetical protein
MVLWAVADPATMNADASASVGTGLAAETLRPDAIAMARVPMVKNDVFICMSFLVGSVGFRKQ